MSRIHGIGKSALWLLYTDVIMLDFKFDPIVSYLKISKEMIKNKELEIQIKFDKWKKKESVNTEFPSAFDRYEKEILEHSIFSELLYNSIYLVLYSKFETHLKEMCNDAKVNFNKNISVIDLKGNNYIDQCKVYLSKVIGLDWSALNAEWSEIKRHNLIRNKIAHANNIIKSESIDRNFKDYIFKTDGISYYPSNETISIESSEFLEIFVDLIKNFLLKLHDLLISKSMEIK
jgi:hypothetical protein